LTGSDIVATLLIGCHLCDRRHPCDRCDLYPVCHHCYVVTPLFLPCPSAIDLYQRRVISPGQKRRLIRHSSEKLRSPDIYDPPTSTILRSLHICRVCRDVLNGRNLPLSRDWLAAISQSRLFCPGEPPPKMIIVPADRNSTADKNGRNSGVAIWRRSKI
jgi:hypothetical protein